MGIGDSFWKTGLSGYSQGSGGSAGRNAIPQEIPDQRGSPCSVVSPSLPPGRPSAGRPGCSLCTGWVLYCPWLSWTSCSANGPELPVIWWRSRTTPPAAWDCCAVWPCFSGRTRRSGRVPHSGSARRHCSQRAGPLRIVPGKRSWSCSSMR